MFSAFGDESPDPKEEIGASCPSDLPVPQHSDDSQDQHETRGDHMNKRIRHAHLAPPLHLHLRPHLHLQRYLPHHLHQQRHQHEHVT